MNMSFRLEAFAELDCFCIDCSFVNSIVFLENGSRSRKLPVELLSVPQVAKFDVVRDDIVSEAQIDEDETVDRA